MQDFCERLRKQSTDVELTDRLLKMMGAILEHSTRTPFLLQGKACHKDSMYHDLILETCANAFDVPREFVFEEVSLGQMLPRPGWMTRSVHDSLLSRFPIWEMVRGSLDEKVRLNRALDTTSTNMPSRPPEAPRDTELRPMLARHVESFVKGWFETGDCPGLRSEVCELYLKLLWRACQYAMSGKGDADGYGLNTGWLMLLDTALPLGQKKGDPNTWLCLVA